MIAVVMGPNSPVARGFLGGFTGKMGKITHFPRKSGHDFAELSAVHWSTASIARTNGSVSVRWSRPIASMARMGVVEDVGAKPCAQGPTDLLSPMMGNS